MLHDMLAAAQGHAARYFRTKLFRMQNRAPIVTFTFDGVPDSAFTNGAAILEELGVFGTYYIAAGTCNTNGAHWNVISPEHVRALHDHGHEIGCQTFSYANLQKLSAGETEDECRKNHNLLRRICGDIQLTNFAYPDGHVTLRRKLQLQKRFDSCRGVVQGINVGTVDLGQLKVIELFNRSLTSEKLQKLLGETCDRNGWLIFYTHDVANRPSEFGCSPSLLRSTIETVQAMGLTCVPVRDALRLIGYPDA
jgi:peptidoglycan/xylan/chitin deacetylase (PgdA/CDA1 family)